MRVDDVFEGRRKYLEFEKLSVFINRSPVACE